MTPDTRPNRLPLRRVKQQAVGFVSYGSVGGARVAGHPHLISGV